MFVSLSTPKNGTRSCGPAFAWSRRTQWPTVKKEKPNKLCFLLAVDRLDKVIESTSVISSFLLVGPSPRIYFFFKVLILNFSQLVVVTCSEYTHAEPEAILICFVRASVRDRISGPHGWINSWSNDTTQRERRRKKERKKRIKELNVNWSYAVDGGKE